MKRMFCLVLLSTLTACSHTAPVGAGKGAAPAAKGAVQAPPAGPDAHTAATATAATAEATSLFGKPLYRPEVIPNAAALEANLDQARKNLVLHPDDPDALIWVGRREGYLWRYRDSLATFTRGIEQFPDNPRLYRHRGHRYLTLREFANAQADFERAAELMLLIPDEIEPDGAPNAAGKPRGTLRFNVWYHLGLAYYLQGDYANALKAYERTMAVSDNDDSIVATSDWMWMTLMRLGRKDDAAKVLAGIRPEMDILENDSYHRRLLMYKGLAKPTDLLAAKGVDSTAVATQGYGVGNYYLVTGQPAKAREVFDIVTSGPGWNAFGYIAAEADLHRMK